MPWRVEHSPVKSGKNWAIKDKNNHVVGRSTSKGKAQSSVRARYASKGKK